MFIASVALHATKSKSCVAVVGGAKSSMVNVDISGIKS